jgi:hypothetical protein
MLFEIEAEIEKRLPEDSLVTKKESDQQPTYTAVPVAEGMDCLELNVG